MRKKKRLFRNQNNDQYIKNAQISFNQGKNILQISQNDQDIKRAIQFFNKAIQHIDKISLERDCSKYFSQRGNAYMKLKEFQKAQKDFQKAIQMDVKNSSSYVNSLGRCHLQMSKDFIENPTQYKIILKKAHDNFNQAISKNQTDGNCYLNRAYVYNLLGNQTNAIKDYQQAIKYLQTPQSSFKAYFHRGILYRKIGQISNSIEDISKACQLKKDDAQAHNNLGLSYFQNSNWDKSLQLFEIAISLNKDNPQFYNNKALALYMIGLFSLSLIQFQKAIKLYSQIPLQNITQQQIKNIQQPQNLAQCLYNRGNTYQTIQQLQKALQNYNVGLKLAKQKCLKCKLHKSRGFCYQKLKIYDLSVKQFQESLQLDPQSLSSLYHLGICQHKKNDLDAAIKTFSILIQQKQIKDLIVLQARGKVYLQMQNYQAALQDFKNAIKDDQNNSPDIYYYLGFAKMYKGKIQSAIDDYFHAIQLGSNNPQIFNGIGIAYGMLKNFKKSLYYFNKALLLNPDHDIILIQRSNVYIQMNQYKNAINDLTKALQKNPNDPNILYRRGLALYKNNQYQNCIKDLYKAFERQPKKEIRPDIHYHLGISFANLDQFQKAIIPLTQAIQLTNQKIPYYISQRAKCYILVDEYQKALQDLNLVIQMQPKNAYAYFRRALTYKALKKFELAAEDFAKARQIQPQNPNLLINIKQIYEIKYIKFCNPGQQMK